MLVGEQPGNEEDLRGEPFVGPAGRILDDALEAAGIARADAYVTNVAKHFKWVPAGKRRLHKKPNACEVLACRPWLDQELGLIKPDVLVCLGATAAQALLGREFRVTVQRGKLVDTALAPKALATIHPSAVLRQQTPEDRAREMARTADLEVAGRLDGPTLLWRRTHNAGVCSAVVQVLRQSFSTPAWRSASIKRSGASHKPS
jgi:uracil-DNA glycosylase family protein